MDDVIIGFELLSSEAPPKFKPILSWLENNYIGKFKPNSRTSRVVPRYPIKMWNLHERVIKGMLLKLNLRYLLKLYSSFLIKKNRFAYY
jgi:hypothetical protein